MKELTLSLEQYAPQGVPLMMKNKYLIAALLSCLAFFYSDHASAQGKSLKLVFIRHGEKYENGDNLNCQGLNRSLSLPAVLYKKFGKPDNVYVPALGLGDATKHARMLQTVTPFAAKYGLNINSAFDEKDYKSVGKALLKESGTVLIVWEHNNIPAIVNYLGVKKYLDWPGDDFDSILIVTFANGKAILTTDKEGLHPAAGCPF